jgi:hypothetical protein
VRGGPLLAARASASRWAWRCRSTVRAWYLPLAIGMVASQLRHRPAWTAAELAAALAAARDRLALMRAENVSVGAAFDLSYQDLSGCSVASGWFPVPTSTPVPPRPSMAPALNRLGELATRTSAIARDLGAAPEEARALEGLG